jgi:hypothetical protein
MTTHTAAATRVPHTAPRRASSPGRIAAHCVEHHSRTLRQRVFSTWIGEGLSASSEGVGGSEVDSSVAIGLPKLSGLQHQDDGIVHGVPRFVGKIGLRSDDLQSARGTLTDRETFRPCCEPRACGAARPWRNRRPERNSRRQCPSLHRGGAFPSCCRRLRKS